MAKVSFDFVKKIMLREKRNIFYLKDSANKVLDFNENDEATVESVIEQIEEALANVSGGTVTIDLPAKPKGKGAVGGDTTLTKLVYTISPSGAAPGTDNVANAPIGGNNYMFQLLMAQMQTNQTLQSQLLQEKNNHEIEKLRALITEGKGRSKADLVEVFADKVANKFLEADRLSNAAKKAATVTALPIQHEAAAAPINSDENNPDLIKKDKIKTALKNFQKVDKDYINNTLFLSQYAANNPEAYRTFIETLKGSSNE
jgi:hypothetical protein